MQLSLDGQCVDTPAPLTALALYGYAVFTTFAIKRDLSGVWRVKGLNLHEQRLQRDALALFGIEPDFSAIYTTIRHFLGQHQQDMTLIIRVTLFPRDFSLAMPENIEALHVLVSGRPLTHSNQALTLRCIDALRIFPQHKTTNLLVNLKARRMARATGADDALLCIDNWLMEGASWNIFFSDGEHLLTPPLTFHSLTHHSLTHHSLTHHLLPGVTRRLIIEAAQNDNITVVEKALHKDQLAQYNGAFASNAASGIVPIAAVDDTHFDVNDALIQRATALYEKTATTAV